MNTKIDASPTKDLFISLLTKDISLLRAILDLIDNSVDAAIKCSKKGSLKGYVIQLSYNAKEFSIRDNCGGMTLNDAVEYAFKFGKDEDTPFSNHSIGRFGVGMKRTLFKIGKNIQVRSKTADSETAFCIPINVDEWKKTTDWSFNWESCEKDVFNGENGVVIVVDDIYKEIKHEFISASFLGKLISQIKMAHFVAIDNGLSIIVNEQIIPSDINLVLYNDKNKNITPLFLQATVSGVEMKMYCGLANRDKNKAGWYIFCNNRLIVEHDQSDLTGWGEDLPKFHENYALFRGYVFFDSVDPRLLPWTSTKTNLDKSSMVYQKAYAHIIRSTKPILASLREMASEKSWMKDEGLIGKDLESKLKDEVPLTLYTDIRKGSNFALPEIEKLSNKNAYSNLTVRRTKTFIDSLREKFGFDSNKEMAEIIFKYFLKRNSIQDEE